jgi:hypothetical protein
MSMIAKLMNLARFLPFWNSLDSVRRVHSDLEFAAIVLFALLAFFDVLAHRTEDKKRERTFGGIGLWCFGIAVACELVAYPYGERNDNLSEQIIVSLSQTALQAKGNAEKALVDSENALSNAGEALGKAETASSTADKAGRSASGALTIAGEAKADVATVQSNIAKVDEKYAPRTLSKIKRDILIELLRKTRKKSRETIQVEVSADAPDGSGYANEIADAINDPTTGWAAKAEGLFTSDGRAKGVFVLIHDTNSAPPWAGELVQVLRESGIGNGAGINPNIPAGTAIILIERKD